MEEQKSVFWPTIMLVAIVVGIAILGYYLYPREQKVASDMTGSSGSLFNTLPPAASTTTMTSSTTQAKVLVTMKTNEGDITLELYPDKAPKTVANFVKLADQGFYNGTLFHRVIKGFMIQGGDPLTKAQPKNWSVHGTGGPGYTFEDEQNDIQLERGVIAMANSGPNTNGSQFFIMTAREPLQLQGYYTAFGRILGSMAAVDKIESVSTDRAQNDHPTQDMVIEKVEVQK